MGRGLLTGFSLLNTRPGFCEWGRVSFRTKMGDFIVVNKRTGGLLTQFVMGRGKIFTFKNPIDAIAYLKSIKTKIKNPCVVRLHNIDLYTKSLSKELVYKGKLNGIECYNYMPKSTKKHTTIKWFDFDWPQYYKKNKD